MFHHVQDFEHCIYFIFPAHYYYFCIPKVPSLIFKGASAFPVAVQHPTRHSNLEFEIDLRNPCDSSAAPSTDQRNIINNRTHPLPHLHVLTGHVNSQIQQLIDTFVS